MQEMSLEQEIIKAVDKRNRENLAKAEPGKTKYLHMANEDQILREIIQQIFRNNGSRIRETDSRAKEGGAEWKKKKRT